MHPTGMHSCRKYLYVCQLHLMPHLYVLVNMSRKGGASDDSIGVTCVIRHCHMSQQRILLEQELCATLAVKSLNLFHNRYNVT